MDMKDRRSFVKAAAGVSLLVFAGSCKDTAMTDVLSGSIRRDRVNALLLSATTNPGQSSLEHAREAMKETYGDRKNILLINFASLPDARDAYEKRMQRDFSKIDPEYRIQSLHRAESENAASLIENAEAFYVSGGNTFLLLRELYDRKVVDRLRERVLDGVPYVGSSAGSNIAGEVIGTTNDFPLVDIPTRRSLGIMPALFNPHHPHPDTDPSLFESRQWKIGEYTRYHKETSVVGLTNPGMLRIRGNEISLIGASAIAFIQRNGSSERIDSSAEKSISGVLNRL